MAGPYQFSYARSVGEVSDRVEATLRAMLQGGTLKPGDQLPSERDLVKTLDAGRTTVRSVLQKLTYQGLIEPQHGRGYFVCKPASRRRA